jgi:ABC-type Na+ efflux pump permease subunit
MAYIPNQPTPRNPVARRRRRSAAPGRVPAPGRTSVVRSRRRLFVLVSVVLVMVMVAAVSVVVFFAPSPGVGSKVAAVVDAAELAAISSARDNLEAAIGEARLVLDSADPSLETSLSLSKTIVVCGPYASSDVASSASLSTCELAVRTATENVVAAE